MIRVLNIISDTNIGGAGRVILNYLKYSDRSGFETLVAVPRGSALAGPLAGAGAKVYEVDGMADKSLDLKVIGELKELIRETDPQIVHTHGSMSGRIAGRQCGKKVIFTRHSAFPVKGYMKKGPGRWLNKLVNEHYADRIIAVSPATAENLTDAGVSPELIDIMMNGVEPVERKSVEERAQLRRDFGIVPGDFVMGIMARIEDYKGHEDILRAMARIVPDHPEAKLIIAGTGSSEPDVRRTALELGLSDNVIFAGFVEDVSRVLSILDLQLNASWGTEASSLAMLEGFSLGIPAVASSYGGNPWQVEDGVNGFLFPPRDFCAMAERIRALIEDRALLEKLGMNAGRIYRERFTGEIFAARLEEIYMKTLEGRNEKGK